MSASSPVNRTYYAKVQENIRISMRMTMLLACPCAVGLFVLAKPILLLLYFNQRENALQAVPTLQVMTIGVVSMADIKGMISAPITIGTAIQAIFFRISTVDSDLKLASPVRRSAAVGNRSGARKVFLTALKLMAVIGAAAFAICFFGADLTFPNCLHRLQ